MNNVDHNLATLSGYRTFHGITTIAIKSNTDSLASDVKSCTIKRLHYVTAQEFVKSLEVTIHTFISPEQNMSSVILKKISLLQKPFILPLDFNLDLLWYSLWIFHDAFKNHSN